MSLSFPASFVSRAISLSAQLLLTMVGLLAATIAGLTYVAYRSSVDGLEAQAVRNVSLGAQTRAQSVQRLLELRRQRADGFLAGLESICAEPRRTGGFGWGEDCTQTMLQEFARGEGADGSVLRYRNRLIAGFGRVPPAGILEPGARARLAFPSSGVADYIVRAPRDGLVLELLFSGDDIQRYFDDRSGLGRTGEVFLIDRDGRFLTSPRYGPAGVPVPGAATAERRAECMAGVSEVLDIDYRGVRTFHGFAPVPALGPVCVDAHVAYDEAVAPAEQLRADLAGRGLLFALAGVLALLIAAHLIAAPVRRLAAAARMLPAGNFDGRVPIAGPFEVRQLGHALAAMSGELATMIKGEREARREAESANRSKDRLLAMVAHEMRTPLSAILGWTKLLRSGRLDAERARRALDAVERSANAQRRLIDDLLDVSRIVAGRLRMIRTSVSMSAVATAALDAVKPLADERGVQLSWDIAPSELTVTGDAQRLQQVVWNLTWNAIKFTPEGGTVRVTLTATSTSALLAVSDSGVGIAADFLPHVFEWFRQDAAGSDIPEAGLGLGLALVRQLVALHGGTVHAESAGQGHGATFVVTLPLGSAVFPATADPARVPPVGADVNDE